MTSRMIIDESVKAKVLKICDNLERNKYIERYSTDDGMCRAYLWYSHFELNDKVLIDLFKSRGIVAKIPISLQNGCTLMVEYGKETEVTLEQCFDV